MLHFASISANLDLSKVYEELNKGVEESVNAVYQKVYEACPVNTGYMRSTIGTQDNTVYVEASYTPYTEYRTGWFSNAVYDSISGIQAIFNIK